MSKDLAYYLSHTDEMPTDPKVIEELANEHMRQALETGGEQLTIDRFVKPDETADPSPDKAKADENAAAEKAAAEKAVADKEAADKAAAEVAAKPPEKPKETRPDGILAKDGKNVIPYSQLESARQRAAEAERVAAQQAEEIKRLRTEKAAGDKPETDVATLTEDELSALEDDSPTLAKVLRAQQTTIQQLSQTVETLSKHTATRQATEEAEIKTEIQRAIDANPVLAEWQTAEDQAAWNEAARVDRMLRESPRYANVSFEDRFKKVVELTRIALEMEPATPKEPALTQEQIQAAAAAKLRAKPAGPRSLSDIPGGAPPAVDEKDRVEQMSSVELGNKFLSMTREQLDAYLSGL